MERAFRKDIVNFLKHWQNAKWKRENMKFSWYNPSVRRVSIFAATSLLRLQGWFCILGQCCGLWGRTEDLREREWVSSWRGFFSWTGWVQWAEGFLGLSGLIIFIIFVFRTLRLEALGSQSRSAAWSFWWDEWWTFQWRFSAQFCPHYFRGLTRWRSLTRDSSGWDRCQAGYMRGSPSWCYSTEHYRCWFPAEKWW